MDVPIDETSDGDHSDYGPDVMEESSHKTDSEEDSISDPELPKEQDSEDDDEDNVPLAQLRTTNHYVVRRKLLAIFFYADGYCWNQFTDNISM